MTAWITRPGEERALLNPAFCSSLMWKAASGYSGVTGSGLPFDLTFLVLPMILHRDTRESLPRTAATSLAAWLYDNPLSRPVIADRARSLRPFTREALLFGGTHELFEIHGATVSANAGWKKRFASLAKEWSDEVNECAKRAEFLGKWFAKAGTSSTVMAVMGLKP